MSGTAGSLDTPTAEALMMRASEMVGSDDFGPAGYREGLDRALDAFARLPLRPEAREQAVGRLVLDLANRLQIEAWYKQHPEIDALEIEGPILVCGLPRTGTTATVGMLALDQRFRFTRMWEMMQPVPPPRLEDEFDDPRAVRAREMAASMMMAQHISDPDGPEEDSVAIFPLDMRGYHGALPMPDDYLRWWMDTDFTSTYAYHRRLLKLLQSQRPPHLWLLKGPVHLFQLEAFAREYPNARFVWTHRDPASVIPSVSSLQHTLHSERCEGMLDKASAGPRALDFWVEGVERGMAARARIGEHRFVDVWNRDVVARPTEAFAELYQKLGFDFTLEFEADIVDYGRRNARGAHGEHHYTAEEYGLTTGYIRERFAGYIEHFQL